MTSADDLVHVARRGEAAVVTLDSPHNRNALSRALLQQLDAALERVATEPDVRVVVLTAAGPVFCSGADLKEQRAGGPPVLVSLPDVLTRILHSPKPVIARVNGSARAGGLGLLAACDLTVGLSSASFGFSEVRIGVAPAIIAVTCLRRMEPRAARELFLTGEVFEGERARTAGLLDRAVADDELDATVEDLVASLARGGPEALAVTKQLLRTVPGPSLEADFEAMTQLSAERFGSAEAREGIGALLAKRDPSWVPSERPV